MKVLTLAAVVLLLGATTMFATPAFARAAAADARTPAEPATASASSPAAS